MDLSFLVPVFGVLGVFFVPGTIVVFILVLQYRRACRREETYRLAIEKGLDPREVIPPDRGLDRRLVGLVFLLGGLALIPGIWALNGWQVASFGLVPVAIGAAYLIAWKLRKAETADNAPQVM